MLEGIELLNLFLTDACHLFFKVKMQVEPNQDMIELGKYLLDWIYKDVSGPYL